MAKTLWGIMTCHITGMNFTIGYWRYRLSAKVRSQYCAARKIAGDKISIVTMSRPYAKIAKCHSARCVMRASLPKNRLSLREPSPTT